MRPPPIAPPWTGVRRPEDRTMTEASDIITIGDFAKVKLRVARVLEAREHPNADKLLILKVDLGGERRQICAGLRGHYTPEQLVGRNLVVVANLAPRMMRGEESNGMLLAASDGEHRRVVFLTPEADIEPGAAVS